MSTAARRSMPQPTVSLAVRVFARAADAVALLVLLALVALALYPVYGTAWLFVAVLGSGVVGIAVGAFATWRKLGPLAVLGVSFAAWLLTGGFLTMPSTTTLGVIPTGRTLIGLLAGPVTAWRDMLMLEPPIGETYNLLTIAGLLGLAVGVTATSIILRTKRPVLAWVPAAGAYLAAAILGSQVAYRPFLVGVAFFMVVLVWTSRQRAASRTALGGSQNRVRPVTALLGIAVLLFATFAAYVAAPYLGADAPRSNLRAAMEPPIDLERYASPLQAYRSNITKTKDTILLDISGGLESDIVRLATMDKYDGMSYTVASLDDEAVAASTFTRVGQWIADDTPGDERDVVVAVRGYRGVWTPTLGRTTSISFEGPRALSLGEHFYFNRSSGTGVDTVGLGADDQYRLEARVPQRPSDAVIAEAQAGDFDLPEVTGVPDELINLAKQWANGLSGAGSVALKLEQQLRLGYFSHGQSDEVASVAGHSERRLITLLAKPEAMVGDHEQYAVAMALMARELGIPARVIYGYRLGANTSVTGSQAGAWPELYFAELGWVTFDPTPPTDRVLNEDEPPPPPQPQPYVDNPPPPPVRPEVPPPDDDLPIDPGEPPANGAKIDWAQLGALAALTGIPLITIVVPIGLIIGLKVRRRSRRRNNPVVANRIAGAWSDLMDKARDLGRSPSAAATRTEQAQALEAQFPKVLEVSDPVALARQADWIVFAPGDPSVETADDYWTSTGAVRRGMKRSMSRLRWLFSGLSTKSFRKVK